MLVVKLKSTAGKADLAGLFGHGMLETSRSTVAGR